MAMIPKKNAAVPTRAITFNPDIMSVLTDEILLIDSCAEDREKIIDTIANGKERTTTSEFKELKIPKSSTLSFLATAT